jgi:hypothetical protein
LFDCAEFTIFYKFESTKEKSKHLSFVCKEILSLLDNFEGDLSDKPDPIDLVIFMFMAHFENEDLCNIDTEHHSQLAHLAKEMLKSK